MIFLNFTCVVVSKFDVYCVDSISSLWLPHWGVKGVLHFAVAISKHWRRKHSINANITFYSVYIMQQCVGLMAWWLQFVWFRSRKSS